VLQPHQMLQQPRPTRPRLGPTGKLRMVRFAGMRWYLSPDLCTWIVPTLITLFLLGGTLTVAGWVGLRSRFAWEMWVLLATVLTALSCSLACGVTDPGVLPRLQPGEVDVNENDETLRLCDFCGIRRPPRANHCHTCDTCVLEHDHHCGVIGGCVGQRSLRWFTLYLLCIGIATSHGCSWLIRSMMAMNNPQQIGGSVSSTPAPFPSPGRGRRGRGAFGGFGEEAGPAMAFHIMLLIFVANVALVVGCLGWYYVFLVCTDTTRREASRGKARLVGEAAAICGHEHRGAELMSRFAWRVFGRAGRVCHPPPSLLDEAMDRADGKGGASDNASLV
jgi:hypothetical protein